MEGRRYLTEKYWMEVVWRWWIENRLRCSRYDCRGKEDLAWLWLWNLFPNWRSFNDWMSLRMTKPSFGGYVEYSGVWPRSCECVRMDRNDWSEGQLPSCRVACHSDRRTCTCRSRRCIDHIHQCVQLWTPSCSRELIVRQHEIRSFKVRSWWDGIQWLESFLDRDPTMLMTRRFFDCCWQ